MGGLKGRGDTATLKAAAEAWRAARAAEADARQQVRAAVIAACGQGATEAEAARLAGVDRMTVRSWLGKR